VSSSAVIAIRNVEKIYQMGETQVRALRGVSLSIEPGEFVAVMGASGSGKSTMMNILGCLDRPTSGEYFLDRVDVSRLDRDQLAEIRNEKIGFVFQSFNLLARTSAIENVELPLIYSDEALTTRERHVRAREALVRVGLSGRETHYPSQLSGGQQQRVAIARALIHDPAIILADEPTGNLDSQTSIEIMALFQELNDSGKTIILITHEHDIAQHSRRGVHMLDGNITLDETIDQVRIEQN
jgi:putative ABC transport system ATP-binding protein